MHSELRSCIKQVRIAMSLKLLVLHPLFSSEQTVASKAGSPSPVHSVDIFQVCGAVVTHVLRTLLYTGLVPSLGSGRVTLNYRRGDAAGLCDVEKMRSGGAAEPFAKSVASVKSSASRGIAGEANWQEAPRLSRDFGTSAVLPVRPR